MSASAITPERTVTNCRMCESGSLEELLDLGHMPPSDNFLTKEDLERSETYYPLKLLFCADCGLAQLSYVVPPEILFSDAYPYESSTSQYLRDHFKKMAETIIDRFGFGESDLAVDIGSNVGVLLGGFKNQGLQVMGVEPVGHLAAKANAAGIDTLNAFFSPTTAKDIVSSHGRASVVTGTNVFAHIDDLTSVTNSLMELLRPDGIFVIEFSHFLDMIRTTEYDHIYHEHLSYISMAPLARFFSRVGFEVFDVEEVAMHGVSLRVYSGFPGQHEVTERVERLIKLEADEGILTFDELLEFSRKVITKKQELTNCLVSLKSQGKRIVGISAPAKGNTLLNYCNITPDILDYLTEKSDLKIGLLSPGMHIPVVDDDVLKEDQPDYGMLMAWNLRDEIIKNLGFFKERGGRFLVPMPTLEIV